MRLPQPLRLTTQLMVLAALVLGCSLTVSLDPGQPAQPTVTVNRLRATFVGQDGDSYAGRLCSTGTVADNVHIHLSGLRSEAAVVSYRVDDLAAGGVWAAPCDPISNWLLHVVPISDPEVDLYYKPFRDAPANTEYTVTVQYRDGQTHRVSVPGTRVRP
ncbi:MAG: hypothetical protein HGB05_17070 [Chloroflexi bacterium]|nr:hypothetical protein [Chloroflexota bacterium]